MWVILGIQTPSWNAVVMNNIFKEKIDFIRAEILLFKRTVLSKIYLIHVSRVSVKSYNSIFLPTQNNNDYCNIWRRKKNVVLEIALRGSIYTSNYFSVLLVVLLPYAKSLSFLFFNLLPSLLSYRKTVCFFLHVLFFLLSFCVYLIFCISFQDSLGPLLFFSPWWMWPKSCYFYIHCQKGVAIWKIRALCGDTHLPKAWGLNLAEWNRMEPDILRRLRQFS